MTLRKSFLARLRENAKRRIWVLVVSLLTFVLAIPTSVAMQISVISQREDLIERMEVKEALYELASGIYGGRGTSAFLFFLIGVFASVAAIQGFSYLYDKNKIDFYHSKPVSAGIRFFSIWTNGILVWLIPYCIGTLLNLVFFASNGILDTALFSNVWLHVLMGFSLYLCIYHLTILAVMLTGKVGVTCLGVLVFLVYEACIRALIIAYYDKFYQFFYAGNIGNWDSAMMPILSPIVYLAKWEDGEWGILLTLLCMALFAAAVLALSYWCYKRRKVELAGSAMTFSAIKPIVKIGVAVPVGLFAGLLVCDIVNYDHIRKTGSAGFPIFIGILGILLTCCLIQVIYEADIKGIFHKKNHIVISLVIAMGIVVLFRFDLTGYDTRLPNMEKVEYATMTTESGYRRNYLDKELHWMYKDEYVEKYMRLRGEDAQAVKDLLEHSIQLVREQSIKEFEENYRYSWVVVSFYNKNGSVFSREIPVAIDEAESVAYIEKVESSEDFIKANESGMSEELKRVLDGNEWEVRTEWDNYVSTEQLSRKQARELLEWYRLDLMKNNYQIKSTELPIGTVRIQIVSRVSYWQDVDLVIYPSYENSVQYLKESGLETEKYIAVEDIEKIEIVKYMEEEVTESLSTEEYYADGYYKETVDVTEVSTASVVYTDEASMQSIVDAAYPGNIDINYWYMEEPREENYVLCIYIKQDDEAVQYRDYNRVYGHDFYFMEGQVPEFVKQDISNASPHTLQ